MRVIAGAHKGRRLKSTSEKVTRPTSDKIKEALFQQIGPYFGGGMCLDLYAGSGALGIEALSRGVDMAVFVDKNAHAIHTIKDNIERLQLEKEVTVYRSDAKRALRTLHKKAQQFKLIFLDPPYDKADFSGIIQDILTFDLLADEGVICCEYGVSQQLPELPKSLTLMKQKTYGSTTGISIYINNQ